MQDFLRTGVFTLAGAVGVLGLAVQSSEAAVAKKLGGSGYSGKLSSNPILKMQQVAADPADAPTNGSTSTSYDPRIVTLSGLKFGPSYSGDGVVEVDTGEGLFLQDIGLFLRAPAGTETGYVQVTFSQGGSIITGPTAGAVARGTVQPGQIPPPRGYRVVDVDGVNGYDTHALDFTYLPRVAPSTVATYTIYADTGDRPSGNESDFLSAVDPRTGPFTLGPGDLSPAVVRGSLETNTIPLPSAVWAGSTTLAGLGLLAGAKRLKAARQ